MVQAVAVQEQRHKAQAVQMLVMAVLTLATVVMAQPILAAEVVVVVTPMATVATVEAVL